MTRTRYLSTLFLLLLALTLSACGFRLRGTVELPPQMARTHIQGVGEYSELGQDLRRSLTEAGATIVETAGEASAIFVVSRNVSDRRVLSVQASGKVQEYELIQMVEFSVRTPEGEVLIEPQRVELSREYLYDRNNPLASGGEEDAIREEMQRDLMLMLMRRLQIRGGG